EFRRVLFRSYRLQTRIGIPGDRRGYVKRVFSLDARQALEKIGMGKKFDRQPAESPICQELLVRRTNSLDPAFVENNPSGCKIPPAVPVKPALRRFPSYTC